jgi:hypothetical protein
MLPEATMLGGGETSPDTLAALTALLQAAGVSPRAELRGPDGLLATGVDVRWLSQGNTMILALQAAAPWQAPERIEINLPGSATVADLRFPGAVRLTQRFPVVLDPVTPTILSIRP